MAEEITPTQEYIRGFNDGYIIEKDMPELATKLSSVKSEADRFKGFNDGRKQFLLDKTRGQRAHLNKDSSSDRSSSISKLAKDKSQDRDR